MLGIEKAKPGKTLREIGRAIQNHVENNGYSCVRDFCGHGIGKIFHMEPQVMHFNEPNSRYQDITLEEGMFFTIEPIFCFVSPVMIILLSSPKRVIVERIFFNVIF